MVEASHVRWLVSIVRSFAVFVLAFLKNGIDNNIFMVIMVCKLTNCESACNNIREC